MVQDASGPLRGFGLGDVDRLAGWARELAAADVGWVNLPHDPDLRRALADVLSVGSSWVWAWTRTSPGIAHDDVEALDRIACAASIRAALARSNPTTSADPEADLEEGWWGARGAAGFDGVVGAFAAGGDPRAPGSFSWRVHGLGVVPQRRGGGLGARLTAAAVDAALGAGARWASLGYYAENDTAARLYRRLGFETVGRFDVYRPTTPARSRYGASGHGG